MNSTIFKYLFSPFKIGSIQVKNRLVMEGHATLLTEENLIGDKIINYYVRRAKGEVGLIITENTSVHLNGMSNKAMLCNHNDRIISAYQKTAGAVHRYGTKIFAQLTHMGSLAYDLPGFPSVAPSRIKAETGKGGIPHVLRIKEIKEIIDAFAKAAYRAREGGLDGVEILAAYGQLVNQFLSPLSNKRDDEYGGNVEKRMKFLLEILEMVREKVGKYFIVGIRLSGDDYIEGGLSLEDTKEIAEILEKEGSLDYLNIGAGDAGTKMSISMNVSPMFISSGSFVYLSSAVKKAVDLPVFCAGRINDPIQAEKILKDGHADMIGMARALICDPDFPMKAREGRIEDIRKCVACNQGCIGRFLRGDSITCIQNPEAGNEGKFEFLKKAKKIKKVMVIGGGPAGMEAARIAAKRGHKVSIYEMNNEPGGQLLIAAKAPLRYEIEEIVRFLSHEINKFDIEVIFGVEATAELIKAENPDVAVIATGSVPFIPPIPGVEGNNNIVTVWDVLQQIVTIGKNVVIVDEERHQHALNTADFLADKGKKIEILTKDLFVGTNIDPRTLSLYFQRLFDKGVKFTPHTGIKEISENTVVTYNIYTNKEKIIKDVDTVVFAVGNMANDDLYMSVKNMINEVYMAGDCIAPRTVFEAINEGNMVGRTI